MLYEVITVNVASAGNKTVGRNGETISFTATFADANGIDETTAPAIVIGGISHTMAKSTNLVWTYDYPVPTGDSAPSFVVTIVITSYSIHYTKLYEVSLVVAKEVAPRAERMRLAFGPGGGSGRQHNSLGVLYARYGMYAEALAEFQAAAALGFASAAVNIGNVAFLTGDYTTAAAWFDKAAADRPEDVAAIIGLARSLYELDRYDEADELFRKATNYMPELAERYGYLSARLSGSTARASAVMDRGGGMLWDE